MPRHDIVTALEIGSSKICCLIGEVNQDKEVEIIGKGYALSRGVKRGIIVDIDEVAKSVETAVMEAEKVAGFEINNVFVGIKNSTITSFNKDFSINLNNTDKAITENDVKKLLDAANNITLPNNLKILHVIPRGFTLDGVTDIKNPVGMYGLNLQVYTHIITVIETQLKNIAKVIKIADLDLDPNGLIFEPLAESMSLLKEEEKEIGAILIDIGAGTTDVTIYKSGHILNSFVLPVGGNHITYDIGVALKVPLAEAERLKITYGSALKNESAQNTIGQAVSEQIGAISFAYRDPIKVSRDQLSEIVFYRISEIFEHIKKQVDKHANNGIYLAGVVLTGGTALTADIAALAEKILGLPARIAYPFELRGLTDIVKNPMYSAAVGLLLKGAQERSIHQNGKIEKVKIKGYFQKLFNWLSEVF